jgi:hypothetical protein
MPHPPHQLVVFSHGEFRDQRHDVINLVGVGHLQPFRVCPILLQDVGEVRNCVVFWLLSKVSTE